MHRNFENLENLAKVSGYCIKDYMIMDLHKEYDYMLGYCKDLKIWEISKFIKHQHGVNCLNKPLYDYIQCNETEIIQGNQKEMMNAFYRLQGLI